MVDDRTRRAIENLPDGGGWPSVDEFEAAAQAPELTYEMLECATATLHHEGERVTTGPILLRKREDGWAVVVAGHHHANNSTLYRPWQTEITDDTTVTLTRGETRLECLSPTRSTTRLSKPLLGAYIYASVLTTPTEPLEVRTPACGSFRCTRLDDEFVRKLEPLELSEGWTEEKVRRLLTVGPPGGARVWRSALTWSKDNDRLDLAYEVHRRYRPAAFCGQDPRPYKAREEFSETCRQSGRPRCHLALAVELIHRHHRLPPEVWVERLPAVVDVDLFLLGLLVDPVPDRRGIAATALVGSTHARSFESMLIEYLSNAESDLHVLARHRLALELAYLLYSNGPRPVERRTIDLFVAELEGVPHATRAFLRGSRRVR